MTKTIYFDNAATTMVDPKVLEAMLPYLSECYGNASSIYSIAKASKKAIDKARRQVASLIGCDAGELYFTSGGTEADNWAIKMACEAGKGRHVITSAIEHHAVSHTCSYLEKKGYEVTYIPVDSNGIVSVSDIENAIREDTVLISIMFANNEIGTLQPIEAIGELARSRNVLFHTDAVQAVGHIPIDVNAMKIDLLSLSAHKIYGPKGVGALYVRKGTALKAYFHGGGQEKGRRAGTENVAGIVGLGKAAELCAQELAAERSRLNTLRDKMVSRITSAIDFCWLNGDPVKRLPGNVNISFEFIEGESILLWLDMKNIMASSGSACTSASLDPSHVLLAIGLPVDKAHGAIRFTLGRYNTEADVDALMDVLPEIIQRLRDMSPLYEAHVKSTP